MKNSLSHLLTALTLGGSVALTVSAASPADYEWTPDHMHVGVRWQPFVGRDWINREDAKRAVIAEDSSYVQFWASWSSMEPTIQNQDYKKHPSGGLQTLEAAVNACNAAGKKVEFVFFHTPRWASVSGEAGGERPKDGLFPEFCTRIATHFKGRVHAWQLSHEANLQGLIKDTDMDFMMNEIMTKGAQAIKDVYDAAPREPVILSTAGCSPCMGCGTMEGLADVGGKGVSQYYDQLIANTALMDTVDALNMNMSDQNNGYGRMDFWYVPSVWGNYDLVRKKLDEAGYHGKKVLAAESWISWDDGQPAVDVDGDGEKTEKDAYDRAVTIIGKCLERGLNTVNLPWCDNSSSWAMGLTKRRDYGGKIKAIKPEIVIPANDGGADIITQKIALRGPENNLEVVDGGGNVFTVEDYINPGDPNHLHYYIWRWYAQIAGGSDEVIRHALADEKNNDIVVKGKGYTGKEQFRIASYNRTKEEFVVLVYASGADGEDAATVSIPATIQTGKVYNNEFSRHDYRGEGFSKGDTYYAVVETHDLSRSTGQPVGRRVRIETEDLTVKGGTLSVEVPTMNRFTTIRFVKKAAK